MNPAFPPRTIPNRWLRLGMFLAISVALLSIALLSFAQSGRSARRHWVGTWATEPVIGTERTPVAANQTIRNIVRVSIGGESVRVRLSNYYGTKPMRVAAAHIALRGDGGSIVAGSDHALTFNGKPDILIAGGGLAISDPVAMPLKDLAEVAVSIYLPDTTGGMEATIMDTARHTNYVATGDHTSDATMPDAKPTTSWFYLTGIEVLADQNVGAVAIMGDSITNCSQCPMDTYTNWPDHLAERIAQPGAKKIGVLNVSKAGNRIVFDGNGDNAARRFDRDVLDLPGVTHVIVYLGVNDIGRPQIKAPPPQGYPGTDVSVEDMIANMHQLSLRAHEHGIKIIATTITPFEDTTFFQACCYYTKEGEAKRETFNHWVLTTKDLDGFIDLDKVVRDPNHPTQWLAAYDRGDHLHSSPEGNKKIADSVDLKLLQ